MSERRRSPGGASSEATLYPPVKRLLENLGYEVKGEVNGCDLVGRRGDEPPVIVELKLRFTLGLLLQGIDRLRLSDRVYVAVPRPPRQARGLQPESAAVRRLCRRLGLGLIVVGRGSVAVVEEPGHYRPRPERRRIARLVDEFDRRRGDLNIGGSRRMPIVTAYRQDALLCVQALALESPLRLGELRARTGVGGAAAILQRDVYGWFVRVGRGTYALSESGRAALGQFAAAVAALAEAASA